MILGQIFLYGNGGVENPLPVDKLKQAVQSVNLVDPGLVEGVTFKSFGLFRYPFIDETIVGSIPNVAGGRWNGVYGIERNFLDVVYDGFYVERERVPLQGGNPKNVVHDLHDGIGKILLDDSKSQQRSDDGTVIAKQQFIRSTKRS